MAAQPEQASEPRPVKRKPRLTAAERQAQRDERRKADMEASIARTLAKAPPPSALQLALLARLCARHPIYARLERSA